MNNDPTVSQIFKVMWGKSKVKIVQVTFKGSLKHLEDTFAIWWHLMKPTTAPKSIIRWSFWLVLCGYSDIEID